MSKISYDISDKILVLSEGLSGKGGVVSVVKVLAGYSQTFHHLASTDQRSFIYKILYFLRAIILLPYYIRIKGTKIVHIHSAAHGSFFRKSILGSIAKLFRAKLIYHIHGSSFISFYEKYNYGKWIDKSLNNADLIIVLSNSWKIFFDQLICKKDKVVVLNNIIPLPNINKKMRSHDPNMIYFLFLGLIGDRKGIFDLLDVIIENREEFENRIKFYIGGNGEVKKLNLTIEDNRLNSFVFFEGWVDSNKKMDLLSKCDVYILPSYNEGLPISILEAMSYSLPIISTNVGGIEEIVHHNENGVIITPGNKEQMKVAMLKFINDPSCVESMGKKGEEIVKPFYPESVIPRLNDIYKMLLDK